MTTQSEDTSIEPVQIESTAGATLRGAFYTGSNPRGLLVVSHGLGEHSACYSEFAAHLASTPGLVDVLTFDYRGHGVSSGKRGYVERYRDFVDDLLAAIDWVANHRPDLPLFVMGHSNGGLVALHAALAVAPKIRGMILSNPSLKVSARVPRHMYLAGLVLRRFAPFVTLQSTVIDEHLTRDPAHLAARKSDTLRHGKINAPLFFGMVEGGAWILSQARHIQLPMLLILGDADPVIDPNTSRSFFQHLGSTDKTLKVFSDMLHEPLNEIGREVVVSEMVSWLQARLPNRPTG